LLLTHGPLAPFGPHRPGTWQASTARIHHDSDIGMVRKRRALEEIIAAGQPPSDLTVAPLVGDPIADSGSGTPAQ